MFEKYTSHIDPMGKYMCKVKGSEGLLLSISFTPMEVRSICFPQRPHHPTPPHPENTLCDPGLGEQKKTT